MAAAKGAFHMRAAEKLRPVTVHLRHDLRKDVEALAEADRRPIGQFLRNVIADYVAANANKSKRVAA
jgi:predicted transcriptional regulator